MLYIHTGHKNESVCIFYTFPTCNCYRFLVLTIYIIHLEMLHNEYHGTCVRGGGGRRKAGEGREGGRLTDSTA